MSVNEQQFSIGEVAKSTGLTVRTLQHYDNIGLLPVSGRTEGGRRFYTQNDILRLEQIVFYKSVGIGLAEIKEKLSETPTPEALETILEAHSEIIMQKIEVLHTALSVMNAALGVLKSGSYPPFTMLTRLIRIMDGSGLTDWADYKFEPALIDHLETNGITLSSAMEIYHSIRELMVEAVTLMESEIPPDSPAAQDIAKRWWNIILDMTGGDEPAVSALSAVNHARDTWPEADRRLFEDADPFIESALEIYIVQNQIAIPDALQEKG